MTVLNGNTKSPDNSSQPAEYKLNNPFVHTLEIDDPVEKIKTAILTVLLLPFRVILICILLIIAWLLACIGLYGLSKEELRTVPLSGWRRQFRVWAALMMRGMFVMGSFHRIRYTGELASAKEAPIVCAGPHTSFFDSILALVIGPPAVVAKAETASLPFFGTGGIGIIVKGQQCTREEAPILVIAPHSTFMDSVIVYVTNMSSVIVRNESMDNYVGKLINFTQPIYVWRDDPNSRHNTIKSIIDRANSKEDWPQTLIFPEGTCTNRSCLITFKPGAFYPGVPIQPVLIRYPNKLDTFTWTWEGPGVLKLLWLTLTQFHTSVEIEFLPVYRPSEEEKKNPKLFALNVRNLMAKVLNVPVSDYAYDDVRRLEKCKKMNNPYASAIIEIEKLRIKAGLHLTNIEEQVVSLVNNKNTLVTLGEFALRLQIPPNDQATTALFSLFRRPDSDVIDFRDYLLCALVILTSKEPTIKLLYYVFKMHENDSGTPGRLTKEPFYAALKNTLAYNREKSELLFTQIDKDGLGYITFDDFRLHLKSDPKYSRILEIKEYHSPSETEKTK